MVTLQFIPYEEIEYLSSIGKIKKLLGMAKEGKIVLLQGKLTKEEELELIKTTMEEINSEFKGIELATVTPRQRETGTIFKKMKDSFVNNLLGNRIGFTIIGPSKIIQQIKKDPSKIELFTKNGTLGTHMKAKKTSKSANKKKRK